jgi:3-oxoadipate enol-lactonase
MPAATRDDRELPYRTHGEGPTVVFVPDACVGPWSWAWVVEALGSEVQTVIYQPHGPTAEDDHEVMAADLEAVLSAVGCRRTHIVGCGLGGQIALTYAASYGRSRSLLLMGTGECEIEVSVRRALLDPDPIESLRPYLGQVVEELDEETLRAWREKDDPDAGMRGYHLDLFDEFAPPPLHEVTLPVRVRHGAVDAVVPPTAGEALADSLPDGTYEVVLEAPHLLPVARPTLVADEVIGLVETVDEQS